MEQPPSECASSGEVALISHLSSEEITPAVNLTKINLVIMRIYQLYCPLPTSFVASWSSARKHTSTGEGQWEGQWRWKTCSKNGLQKNGTRQCDCTNLENRAVQASRSVQLSKTRAPNHSMASETRPATLRTAGIAPAPAPRFASKEAEKTRCKPGTAPPATDGTQWHERKTEDRCDATGCN